MNAMSTAISSLEASILDEVTTWPASARLSLVSKIVESLQMDQLKEAAAPMNNSSDVASSIEHLIGLCAGVHPKPSDEDVKRIIEEERLRKFGVK